MKFPQVPIGRRFDYQGRHYTKTGPLTASEEGTGQSRLIMKSAEVRLLDEPRTRRSQEQKPSYSRDEVESLLNEYRTALQRSLLEAADPQGTLNSRQIMGIIERQPLFPQAL